MWTQFMDMHSGGGQKEKWEYIYIEAPEEEAKVIFYNRFGHNPERVTCTCCGEDYSIREAKDLSRITAYERGCAYDSDNKEYIESPDDEYGFHKYVTLEEYISTEGDEGIFSDTRLFIYAKDIKPEERVGGVPEQGYVWVD